MVTKRIATDGFDIFVQYADDDLARAGDDQLPIREFVADYLQYITWDTADDFAARLRLRQYPDVAAWSSIPVGPGRDRRSTAEGRWSVYRRSMEYDDGRILCDERGLVIRWYGLRGAKKVPYDRIRAALSRELSSGRGRYRIWGSSDLRHWYNLDATRPRKKIAIVLDLGGWLRPVITPDEPDKVIEVLRRHGVDVVAG